MEQSFISDSRFSMDNSSWGDDFDRKDRRQHPFRLSVSEKMELVAVLLTLLAAAGAMAI